MLFHPGGDYICASFARMLFPSKTMNDEFVSVIVNPVAGLDEWSRMESWFSYRKCLKQRWPVTALSWKQKDIQRLQTSNRYTITKQGVYQTSSRYHNIRYHFSDKGNIHICTWSNFLKWPRLETCRKIFHISNVATLSKDQQKISWSLCSSLETRMFAQSGCPRAMQAGTFGWGGVVMVECFWTYFFWKM